MKSVSPYTTTLDQGNAYWMARISGEVYKKVSDDNQLPDEKGILASLKSEDEGFLSVFGVDKNSAQSALIEHVDYLCMAFRGTNELADWLDNINVFARAEIFGEFHRGFFNSLQDVWHQMETRCTELQQKKRRPVFFAGHSLGGAMATIAAAQYIHRDMPFTSTYTFGQPRALTRKTAHFFNMECKSRFFRFHNNNDLVTRVPARLMGYSHVGSYLYISYEKTIHQESGFWFRFIDCFDGALSALQEKGIDGIEDHAMGRYLEAIARWQLE